MPGHSSDGEAGSIRIGDRMVHRLGLGTNRVTNTPATLRFLRRAVELGIDFIDTADVYQSGASEETIGEALPPAGPDVLVATKGGLLRTPSGYEANGQPEHLRQAIESSLQRLRRDRLDLYYLHRVDARVPIEESLAVIRDAQKNGRIRHVGVSNVTVSELERARKVVKIVSVQNRFNVIEREHEDVLKYCETHGIVFVPWTPLVRGKIEDSKPLKSLARRRGVKLHQLALSWLLRRSPVILPIPGTLSEEHLKENLAAVNLSLDADEMSELDQCSAGGTARSRS
jgi:pyridoxine 4-dehydrogenase